MLVCSLQDKFYLMYLSGFHTDVAVGGMQEICLIFYF